jgi:hypothetical protein
MMRLVTRRRFVAVRRRQVVSCLVAASAFMSCTAQAAEPLSREYQIKGAYLYKLADYVEWPATAFPNPSSALMICLVGGDPFGSALDAVTAGEHVAGHAVVVKHAPTDEELPSCHVAYLGGANNRQLARVLALFINKPVLTITDGNKEDGDRGIVNFVVRDDRVRFEIDDRSAARVGLSISSKLLNLAVAVRSRVQGGTP